MKTKNKLLALLEIAVVLCSMFLVATLPVAAITNYESGITNYEEAAQEDKTLDIYGNANEDDTIDMRDLTQYLRKPYIYPRHNKGAAQYLNFA